eukprot:10624521-Alexandrium_andersonii.AAC.1
MQELQAREADHEEGHLAAVGAQCGGEADQQAQEDQEAQAARGGPGLAPEPAGGATARAQE